MMTLITWEPFASCATLCVGSRHIFPAYLQPNGLPAAPATEPTPPAGPASADAPSPAVAGTPPKQAPGSAPPKTDLASLPIRPYLETTVVPILMEALQQVSIVMLYPLSVCRSQSPETHSADFLQCVKERPEDPIDFLAQFLNKSSSTD